MTEAAINPTPPLHSLGWNGHTLEVVVEPGVELELWIDGACFVRWPDGTGGRCMQTFAWPPGGRARMAPELRHHGLPLHAPVGVAWGQPGITTAVPENLPLRALDAAAEERLDLATIAGRAASATVDIIVPIYNAPVAVMRCLAALREHTLAGARLLLIDDASTDAGIAPLLAMAAEWPGVRVLANRRNRGFTTTVNRGLEEVGAGDVVLLNADTQVGPGWLGALRRAAWARPDTGSATAVSDNAGAFSVPELEQANPLPPGWDSVDASRALLQDAGLAYPRLPTGNGFCMYLRHDARRATGKLDAEAFPQGYGEENDWSQRAERAGFRHVIAGTAFVAHARSQSFGEQRRVELGAAGMEILRRRYPGYEAAVGAQIRSWERLVLDWRVRRRWIQAGAAPRPRVLLDDPALTAAWSGWECWLLYRDGREVRLLDASGSERESCAIADLPEVRVAWLQRYGFEAASLADAAAPTLAALGIADAREPAGIRYAFRA